MLVAEDDPELRSVTTALLADPVDIIECESAEAALAVMLIRERDVAMIFADVRLAGVMDGIDLAWEVEQRWPALPVVLPSGYPREGVRELPRSIAYIAKPWQPLSILVIAEQALAYAREQLRPARKPRAAAQRAA